jgi:hypothetical protein
MSPREYLAPFRERKTPTGFRFTFLSDSGRCWLAVSRALALDVLQPHGGLNLISNYSYLVNCADGPLLLLEEDRDASLFVACFKSGPFGDFAKTTHDLPGWLDPRTCLPVHLTAEEIAALVRHLRAVAKYMEETPTSPGPRSWFSCNCITGIPADRSDLDYPERDEACDLYEDIFRPCSPRPTGEAWTFGSDRVDEWTQDDRIVAVCLAAAIIESGGL